jgi:alcohol dehydrogenase class IV
MSNFNNSWNYPTKIIFGAGQINILPDLCKDYSFSCPLLVTDDGFKDHPVIKNIYELLRSRFPGTKLYSDIKPNPSGSNVTNGVSFFNQNNHDGIIAVGGGSAIDAAKAMALIACQDSSLSLWDFIDEGDNWKRADKNRMTRVIAVPTTAGTGSEVGRASVITDEEQLEKRIIFHPDMTPVVVVADPELTFDLPPHLTAATGIDAFVHSFEAYCSPLYHPMAEGVAIEGMRLVCENILTAFKHPSDLTARTHMLSASIMGATAFQRGLGAVHALAHPIGAMYDYHHGLINAVLLPYVIQVNKDSISSKLARLSRYLGLGDQGYDDFMSWVIKMRQELNIPHALSEMENFSLGDADELAKKALQDPSSYTNPLEMSEELYKQIIVSAYHGNLDLIQKAA